MMGGKLVEVLCPHCKETRTVQKKNRYDSSTEKTCRPCNLEISKKYFGSKT